MTAHNDDFLRDVQQTANEASAKATESLSVAQDALATAKKTLSDLDGE